MIHLNPILCLFGTKRRVNILKTIIEKQVKKNDSGEITLEYTSKYSNQVETYRFMISELEYRPHGGNQTNLIIVSPQIDKLSRYIQTSRDVLTSEIQATYYQICQNFIGTIEQTDGSNLLSDAIAYTSECDLIQSKCYIATKYNYCKPEIDGKATKSYVDFRQIRHPLIEQLNQRELYVTNDLCIGKEGDVSPIKEGGKGDVSPSNVSPSNGMLLYGTNAVGKTSLH